MGTTDNIARAMAAAASAKVVNTERVLKLLRLFEGASNGRNPYDRELATGVTVTVNTATDVSLGAVAPLASGNPATLTSAALNQIAWYGGIPKNVGNGASKYVTVVSTSSAPGNGNLQTWAGTNGITADMSGWSSALEIETDMQTIEIGCYLASTRYVTVQVNGQYVDKVGHTNATGNADSFIRIAFAAPGVNRVRLSFGPGLSGSATFPFQIRGAAGFSFWKPDQSQVVRTAVLGDSYTEPQGDNVFVYPNGGMMDIAAERLGIRDKRTLGVGGCGIIATNGGTRSNLRAQMGRTLDPAGALYQGPFHLLVEMNGFNDYSFVAQVEAELLYDLRWARALHPDLPMVVLGSQCGRRGPDAGTLAVEDAKQAAVVAFNDPMCKFVPVARAIDPWTSGTGYNGAPVGSDISNAAISSDSIHPSSIANGAGHRRLGYRATAGIWGAVRSMMPA